MGASGPVPPVPPPPVPPGAAATFRFAGFFAAFLVFLAAFVAFFEAFFAFFEVFDAFFEAFFVFFADFLAFLAAMASSPCDVALVRDKYQRGQDRTILHSSSSCNWLWRRCAMMKQ